MCTENPKDHPEKLLNRIIEYKTNILFPLAKAIQLEHFKKILFTEVNIHICVYRYTLKKSL